MLIPLCPLLTCARRLVGSWWGRSWRGNGPGAFPVKQCTQTHPSPLRRLRPLSDRSSGPFAPSSWPASSWITQRGWEEGTDGGEKKQGLGHVPFLTNPSLHGISAVQWKKIPSLCGTERLEPCLSMDYSRFWIKKPLLDRNFIFNKQKT